MSEDGKVLTWVLAFVLTAGAGFAALVGIGCAIGANACPFSESERLATTEGVEIWSIKCAACHGTDGRGGRGPSLVEGPSAALARDQLEAKITRGRPFAGMPRYKGELTEEQIEAVAAYVVQLREGS